MANWVDKNWIFVSSLGLTLGLCIVALIVPIS